jgi:hypothetical protein
MNFLEACKTVRQECGVQGDSTPAAVTNQLGMLKRIVEWVQAADNEINTKWSDWDFLWSEFSANTIIGDSSLLKPADFGMWDKEAFSINKGSEDGYELPHVVYKEYRINVGLKTNQKPISITVLPNGNLATNQPSDAVYPISGIYWRTPIVLAADTDIPAYPVRFHRALVARAKMFFFEDQEAWDNFQTAKDEYTFRLDELEADQAPGQQFRKQSEPEQLVVRPM